VTGGDRPSAARRSAGDETLSIIRWNAGRFSELGASNVRQSQSSNQIANETGNPAGAALLRLGGSERAVAANELTSELNSAEKAASSSRIRALLGERLRDYYDRLQHIPPSDRIRALVTQLEQRIQEEGADQQAPN
jgi:hypothetical protein